MAGDSQHPGQSDKQYAAEQLAMIQAAMMEELGVSRKDTLPLEDRGPSVPLHKLNAVKKSDPSNPWLNVQFDDIDPAEDELDSIADGQLYRLRRGASSSSAGRGRGNFSSRGGHAPNGGRGHQGRGGYSFIGDRGMPQGRGGMPNPQAFFDNVRRNVGNNARIEAAINRLRDEPSQTMAAQKQKRSKHGKESHQPSQQTAKLPRGSTYMAVAGTRFGNLTDPLKFTAHFGELPQPVAKLQIPVAPQKETIPYPLVPTHSKPDDTSAKKLPPPSSQPVIENASPKTNNLPFKPKAFVGLAGSRFAPAPEPKPEQKQELKREPKQEPKEEPKQDPKLVPFEHVSQVPQARYRTGLMPHQQAPPAKASVKTESVASREDKKSDENQSDVSLNSSKKPDETDSLIEKLTKVGLSGSMYATKSTSSTQRHPFAIYSSTSSARSNSEAAANNADVGSRNSGSPTVVEHLSSRGDVTSQARSVVSVLSSASITAGTINPQSDAPLAGLKSSIWAPTLDKPLVSIRNYSVKVVKNGAKEVACVLRVTRADPRSPVVLVIETTQTGERILEESVFSDATFIANSSTITFRANHKGDSSPTWKIEFQLPFVARGAYQMVVHDPYRRIAGSRSKSTVSETSAIQVKGSSNSIAQLSRPAGPEPHAALASLKRDIDRQFSERPITSEPAELISIASDSELHDDVNVRIEARTLNLLSSLQGGERLLDIDDDDVENAENDERIEENVAAPSALMDLAVLNDDGTVQGVFNGIDAFYGNFLEKLLEIVEGNELPHDASTQDFLCSKPHIMAAESLVSGFFGHSNVFAQLKQEKNAAAAYITDMGWKVLAKALIERDEDLENAAVEAISSPTINVEAANGVPVADTKPPAKNEAENATHDNVSSDTESTRKFSVDKLLSMRPFALDVKQELLSKEDMAPRPSRAALAPSVARAAASSVGSWQSFANAPLSQSTRSSSPVIPKVDATDLPVKIIQEQPAAAESANITSAAPEKSKQGHLPPHLMPSQRWLKSFKPVSEVEDQKPAEVISNPKPTTKQAEGPSAKPAAIFNSRKEFAKTESAPEPEKRAQKPVDIVQDEVSALDSQSPPMTPSKARLVEVYKARDLTPTTSTGGWKAWAKDTSGLEPSVRAPTLVTPKAVTSTNGWQSFATAESGVEPEKPKQANPASVVTQNQASVVQQVEPKPSKTCEKSVQAPMAIAQDKPVPSHLRKLKPTEDVKQVQNTTTEAPVQEKPAPPHSRKVEPTATAVNPALEKVEVLASKTALQDETTPFLSAGKVQGSIQDKLILLSSTSDAQATAPLPKVEPQHVAADEKPKAIATAPPSNVATSVGAWGAFAGLKAAKELKVVEKSAPVVASQSTPAVDALPKPDPAVPEKTGSETTFVSSQQAESKTVKSVVDVPPTKRTMKLEQDPQDEEKKPSLDFFTTAPPTAQQNSMATPHPLLKSAPGLSASRFAPGGSQASLGTRPPRPHVEDTQDDPKPIKFKERVQPPFPTARPPRSYVVSGPPPAVNSPVMQFSTPGAHHTTYVQNGYQVPSPSMPRQPAPPAMTTILVPDPNTGILVEVTGYVKATPLTSPQPSPAYPSPFNYENVGYPEPLMSQAPYFPPRSDMYRNVSHESSGSEKQFSPEATAFKTSPPRNESQGAESRPPLSPVRRENVQATLQQRLNHSLARSPGR